MDAVDAKQGNFHLDSFRKILELERSKGYADGSVVGGLDKYLERWAPELAASLGDPSLAPRLARPQYRKANIDRRERLVGRLLELMDAAGQANAPSQQARSGRSSRKSKSPARQQAIGEKEPPAKPPGLTPADLSSAVTLLRGVNSKTADRLKRLGVESLRDLLYLFPRRHEDYAVISRVADLSPGESHTVLCSVWEARQTVRGPRAIKCTEAVVSDETGSIRVTFFGRPHMVRQLHTNSRILLSGRVDVYKGQLEFQSPEYELLDRQEDVLNAGRLVPVYPLTEGLTQRTVRRFTWQALERWSKGIEDSLGQEILTRNRLMALPQAIAQAHYPSDLEVLEEARRRLAFDELLVLQLAVLCRRQGADPVGSGVSIASDIPAIANFVAGLPFQLTEAQKRCLTEIGNDMAQQGRPMERLLQGDVGSGKTVVALVALLASVGAGYQGAIMAPTEVLAEQHFGTVSRLLGGLPRPAQEQGIFSVYLDPLPSPVSVGLLVGGTPAAAKREVLRRLADGTLDIAIGTHALIQEGVEIPRLATAVVDEQHRFGVLQREALRESSDINPHLLVMSATPIPRTLALTLYGDLHISTIDELPPGREQILTRWVSPDKREAAYGFVRREVGDGRQAFVVCPLIEESESVEARAAAVEYQRLSQQVFPDLRLGLLHGRLRPTAKDAVMRSFRDGELDILVSTPVVEVGIDVPNASVMLVEGADRFGLAQLHQFRGRVGRGSHKSYCLLMANNPGEGAKERLSAVERIHDGFQLAEVDLTLRGPGDFFGTRQSGLPTLRMARLSDTELLAAARQHATAVLEEDPALALPEHQGLASQVAHFLQRVVSDAS